MAKQAIKLSALQQAVADKRNDQITSKERVTYKKGALKGKLTEEAVCRKAIKVIRANDPTKLPHYTGVHSIYDGFNNAIKDYYGIYRDAPGVNPHSAEHIEGQKQLESITNKLMKEGKLIGVPKKGGYMFYLPEEYISPAKKNTPKL